eukprot:1980747-Amphidinium_carterae.1
MPMKSVTTISKSVHLDIVVLIPALRQELDMCSFFVRISLLHVVRALPCQVGAEEGSPRKH